MCTKDTTDSVSVSSESSAESSKSAESIPLVSAPVSATPPPYSSTNAAATRVVSVPRAYTCRRSFSAHTRVSLERLRRARRAKAASCSSSARPVAPAVDRHRGATPAMRSSYAFMDRASFPPCRRAWTVGARSLRWSARSMDGFRLAPWPYLASNAGSYQGMISASGSSVPRLASRSASVPGVPGSAPGLMRWEVKCPVAFMRASWSHFSFPLAPKSVSSLRIESRAGGNRRHLR